MNKLVIIGNLARDPELRTMQDGTVVCNFTVAVNRRLHGGETAADFVDVSAWGKLGEVCSQYLAKGRKAMVCGRAGARGYISQRDGNVRASLTINAEEVEFLSGRSDAQEPRDGGFTEIEDEGLPFN